MADTKVSGLTAAASFLITHELPVNEAGTSKKVTGLQILALTAQGTLGYVQVTASQTPITAQVDLTSLTVTVNPLAGRRLKITGYCPSVLSSVADDIGALYIMEGITQLQVANTAQLVAAGGCAVMAVCIVTPTAALHTYKLQGARLVGSGNLTFSAGVSLPMYILVEDIGT